MFKSYNDTPNEEKLEFIAQFSPLPNLVREEKYQLGLLPPEAWGLFFKINYPAPHNFWIAFIDGQAVARIGANISAPNPQIGQIGFFECHPDHQDLGLELIEKACLFLKQNGANNVVGPINFNTWFQYRFMEPAQDPVQLPFEPICPPFYIDLFKQAGLKEHERYSTKALNSLDYKMEKLKTDYDRNTNKNLQFKYLNPKADLENQIDEIYTLAMKTFSQNYLFEPIPLDVFKMLYLPAIEKYDFEYSTIVYNEHNELIGFFFSFASDPYLILKTIGIDDRYRGQGLSNALMYLSFKKAEEKNLSKTIAALYKDDNQSKSYSQGGNVEWLHHYWLYKKNI